MAGKTLDDYVNDLDKFVSRSIKKIPYERLPLWKDMLFRPDQTIKGEMKNASLATGAKDIAVASLANLAVIALFMAEYAGIFVGMMLIPLLATSGSAGLGACMLPLGIAVLVILATVVAFVIASIISWLFYAGVEFVIARLLGGKGEYNVHAYLESILNAALMAAMLPVMALYIIPCFLFCNAIVQPFIMVLSFYTIYVRYRIVKQVHGLERNKAIAVVLIPVILVMALVVVFYLGLFALNIMADVIRIAANSSR